MTAQEAVSLSEEFDGKRPPSLDLFLEYVGLSEAEFQEIASGLSVHPYSHDFSIDVPAKETWDSELWYRE